jgi:hypothetical protein
MATGANYGLSTIIKVQKYAMYPTNISAILLLLLLILIIRKKSQTVSHMEKVSSREVFIFRKVQRYT